MTGVSQHQGVRNTVTHYITFGCYYAAPRSKTVVTFGGSLSLTALHAGVPPVFSLSLSLDFCPIFRKSGHYAD